MTTSSHSSSGAPAGAWRRAAESSTLWSALTPVRRLWSMIEDLIRRATTTQPTANADRRVEQVLASSWIVRAADRAVDQAIRAGRGAATVAWYRQTVQTVAHRGPAPLLRTVSQLILVAAGTTLLLQTLAARPAPLTWIVPAAFAACAAFVLVVADRFDAAWKDKR